MSDHAAQAAHHLRAAGTRLGALKCVVGLDGFVDSLYRVVRGRGLDRKPTFYRTIPEFAARVAASAGKSSDTEIVLQEVRAGGNGPILAGALARLGATVSCIGGLGENGLEEPFRPLGSSCDCVSLGPAGRTTALEFDDGKLMLGDDRGMADLSWDGVVARVGRDRLRELARACDLIALVDWAYLHNMSTIVDSLCTELLAPLPASSRAAKHLLFDLADVSTREPREVRAMCHSVQAAADVVPVILGLNQNEAEVVSRALDLGDPGPGADLANLAGSIRAALGVHVVAIHAHDRAAGAGAEGPATVRGYSVDRPRLTIGGGDVFNAGLGAGLALGAALHEALLMGRAAASLYVATGREPTAGDLAVRLERNA